MDIEYCHKAGNGFFALGDFESAVREYTAGLRLIRELRGGRSEAFSGIDKTEVKLCLNRSICNFKLRYYDDVVKDCTVALRIDSQCTKALIRRATAYEYTGDYGKALNDAESAANKCAHATLLEPAMKLISRLRRLSEQDSAVMKVEGRPMRMVTSQQTLRLAFIETPPHTVEYLEPFKVRLCIGNEFGLWDRSLVCSSSSSEHGDNHIDVLCEVLTFSALQQEEGLLKGKELSFSEASMSRVRLGTDGKVEMNLSFSGNHLTVDTLSGGESTRRRKEEANVDSLTNGSVVVILKFTLSGTLPSGAAVVPVLSLPVVVTGRNMVKKEGRSGSIAPKGVQARVDILGEKVCASCIRSISIVPATSSSDSNPDNLLTASLISSDVYALESPGLLGIGGKLWDSTYVLLDYLGARRDQYITGKSIVELGCGTGLAGIGLCSMDPAAVILTDMAEVIPLVEENLSLNSILLNDEESRDCLRHRYAAMAYSWGTDLTESQTEAGSWGTDITGAQTERTQTPQVADPVDATHEESGAVSVSDNHSITSSDVNDGHDLSNIGSKHNKHHYDHQQQLVHQMLSCDLVIASDVVYDPIGYEPLVKSLCDLLRREAPDRGDNNDNSTVDKSDGEAEKKADAAVVVIVARRPICILAHRHRHPEDAKFFALLNSQEGIHVELLRGDPAYSGSSLPDDNTDNSGDSATLSDVKIFLIYFD